MFVPPLVLLKKFLPTILSLKLSKVSDPCGVLKKIDAYLHESKLPEMHECESFNALNRSH